MSFRAIIRNDFTAAPYVDLKLGYGKHNGKILNHNECMIPFVAVFLLIHRNVFVVKRCQIVITNQFLLSFITSKLEKSIVYFRSKVEKLS